VGHHRSAQDPSRQHDAFGAGELRHHGVVDHLAPDRLDENNLNQVAQADHADQSGDHRFEGTEAVALQAQDQEGDDAGEDARHPEGHAEEEVEA